MEELEIPVKRGRGRPKGSTSKKRYRRSEIQVALDGLAKKAPDITQALIDNVARMDVETDRLKFLVNEYARAFKERKETTRQLTRAIQKMANQKPPSKSDKINLNIFVPVALFHEFNNILEESPLNKSEIMVNLLLNYIKAHKSFSNSTLREINEGVTKLEKQEYRNTKIAAQMLVHAPYDAVRHNGLRSGNIEKTSILDENTADQVYTRRVDEKYTREEVTKAIHKSDKTVDVSELFKDDD